MGDIMNDFSLNLINKTIEIISSNRFLTNHRISEKHFTRNRKMNFVSIINFCVNFVRKSLQLELDNFIELTDPTIEKTHTKASFFKG